MRRSASEIINDLESRIARLEKSANQLSLPFSDSSEVLIVRNTSDEIRVHVKKEIAKRIYNKVRIAQEKFKNQIIRTRGMNLPILSQYTLTARYSDVVFAKTDKENPPAVDPRMEFLDKVIFKYLTCELHKQSRQGKEWSVLHFRFNKDALLKSLKDFPGERHYTDDGRKYSAGYYDFTFENGFYKKNLDILFSGLEANVKAVFADYLVSGPSGYFNISNNITDAYRLASRD